MSQILSIALALAVGAHGGEPKVALEIDLSALPATDVTDTINEHLVARQTEILHDGGIEVVDDADATIRVTVSRYGEGDIHYRFTVALFEDRAATATTERTLTCELCRDSELVTKVGEEVARVSGRLLAAPSEDSQGDPEVVPERAPPGPDRVSDAVDSQPVRRVGAAGWAGISVAAAGVGFGIGGVVTLLEPEERAVRSGDDRVDRVTRPRPLGLALVGVGAGLLVAGAALIAVDQTVLLERRRHRPRRASLAPSLSPTTFGLSWSGRF